MDSAALSKRSKWSVPTAPEKAALQHNVETFDPETSTWTIKVGDSAIAWAKAVGKLVAGKFPAKTLILDFSEIRPAGTRSERLWMDIFRR